MLIYNCLKVFLQTLNMLFQNSANDPTMPNLKNDKFTIDKSNKIIIANKEAYELKIVFIEYELSLESVLIPINNDLYIISAFFNKNVDKSVKERFRNSIVIKN
jgi:hypothetical protein